MKLRREFIVLDKLIGRLSFARTFLSLIEKILPNSSEQAAKRGQTLAWNDR